MKTAEEIKATLPETLVELNQITLDVMFDHKVEHLQESLYWQAIKTAYISGRADEATERLQELIKNESNKVQP